MSAEADLVVLLDLELEVRVLESLLAMRGERRAAGRKELQARLARYRGAIGVVERRLLSASDFNEVASDS